MGAIYERVVDLALFTALVVVHNPGLGHVIMPTLPVIVDENPEVTEPEHDGRNAVADEADE